MKPSPGRSPQHRRRCAIVAVALAALFPLAACTSAPTAPPATSPSTTAAQPDIAGRFDVGGGRELYLECHGTGSPVVVLIGGLRAAADYWSRADDGATPVASALRHDTRVCAYDRPGTVRAGNAFSRSDPIPQPSSEQAAVADLHALLTAAGVRGPYLLAAHSYGGLIARLYASTHPQEVVGLVLIDALSEGFADAMTPEEFTEWQASQQIDPADIAEYPGIERLDMAAVLSQIRSAPPLPPLPLMVLSADVRYGPIWQSMIDSGAVPPGTPADLGAVIDRAQVASQDYQAALEPGAVHITRTHSGHDIPLQNPALVTQEIQRMLHG
ncbi:MAG: alpha/beta hydrolase [Actinobacteria bacterium]|nr:alpha/beta hydrolase [Actinomycetota bacterium]